MVRTMTVNAQDLFVGSIPSFALAEHCLRDALQRCGYHVGSSDPAQAETQNVSIFKTELRTLVMKIVMGIPSHAIVTFRQIQPGLFTIIFHF